MQINFQVRNGNSVIKNVHFEYVFGFINSHGPSKNVYFCMVQHTESEGTTTILLQIDQRTTKAALQRTSKALVRAGQ